MDEFKDPGESGEFEEEFLDPVNPDERSRLRANRARKRELKRKRARIFWSVAVVLLVALFVTLGVVVARWDSPVKTSANPTSSGAEATGVASSRPPSSQPASAPASQPAAIKPAAAPESQPAAGAGSAPPRDSKQPGSYCWVAFEPPQPKEKKSVKTPPTIAIVVDDVGNTREPLAKWTAIDAPISFSVMPYPPVATELAWQLHQSGYQVMMHIPTQNAPPNSFSGKGQLSVGMDRAAVFTQLDADVVGIPYVGGINNHQGGLGCDDLGLMTSMCQWAQSRGFYIVDSNSSVNSQVTPATLALGQPKRKNQVFIDHQNDPAYIRSAFGRLVDIARENGTAIGICHWHRPNTPTIVGEMVKELKGAGVNFAFVKDITN